jgi:hypothetical protein
MRSETFDLRLHTLSISIKTQGEMNASISGCLGLGNKPLIQPAYAYDTSCRPLTLSIIGNFNNYFCSRWQHQYQFVKSLY